MKQFLILHGKISKLSLFLEDLILFFTQTSIQLSNFIIELIIFLENPFQTS